MLGQGAPYAPVPYFWSDQYDLQLQMVGYAPTWDRVVVRGGIEGRSLAAFYLDGDRLRAVVLISRVRDLGPARRLVAAGAILDPAQLADETVDLRRLIPHAP
jgi:3-phenylpropionate/trans-cinnamate dioxygenase ferredoxin reductase subunit